MATARAAATGTVKSKGHSDEWSFFPLGHCPVPHGNDDQAAGTRTGFSATTADFWDTCAGLPSTQRGDS